jgi:hypothetical protein
MKMNLKGYLGFYIGLSIGIILAYFSFGIIFHLAETGNFHIWALLIPLSLLIILPIIGLLIEKFIRKNQYLR